MNLSGIAIKNTRRNLFRTVLTVLGVAVAMLAFLLLRTMLSAWTSGVEYAAKDRLATRHKVTMIMTLPRRYLEDVKSVEGVHGATFMSWFGARLPGREDEFFPNMAIDPKSFFEVYDEIEMLPEQKAKFMEDRRGAIIGRTLAEQHKWKAGDRVTLEGTVFPGNWEFEIAGIYTAKRRSFDELSFFFHWDYLNDSDVVTGGAKDQIGWIVSRVPDVAQAATVSQRIDKMFDVRDTQTLTMSERAMQTSFMGMVSTLLDALQIVSVVILLIMMLILGNTIAMGVRERTHEYGVLRAIGFMPKHLTAFVLGEASVLGLLGGLAGVGLGFPLINGGLSRFMEENFAGMFPYFRIHDSDVAMSVALAVVLAVIAAAIPAWQAGKLNVTDALRKVG
jgi:putative ABC transport system permease protein